MRVLFLQNIWREYFSVMMLTAVLRERGHVVRVAIPGAARDAVREVGFFDPGLVCFSFTNCEQAWVLEAAAAIKAARPNLPIIVGGPHPTLHPELARRGEIDVVSRGESERALADYVDALETGGDWRGVDNLCFMQDGELIQNPIGPLVENLDELPLHDRESYYRYDFLKTNPVKFFFSGRGCPFNCSFCFNIEYRSIYPNKSRYIRKWSIERVMKEIWEVKARYPMSFVRFEDDVFTLKPSWLKEFLPIYRKEIGLPFLCYLRAGEKEETIEALADAGCHTVLFGVETGDEGRRNELLGKGVKNDEIRKTAAQLHKHGIHFFTSNMLGLPGETWETALKTVRLNQEIKAPDVWCSVFQPYAGLAITKLAVEKGYLRECDAGTTGVNTFSDNVLSQPDQRRIFNLHKFFYPLVRWPWLEPAVLPLTKLPPNALFHYTFVFFYAVSYMQHTKISLVRLFQEGMHWFRVFLAERKS